MFFGRSEATIILAAQKSLCSCCCAIESTLIGMMKNWTSFGCMRFFMQFVMQHIYFTLYRQFLDHSSVCGCAGKKRIIAETGAGQHGVATATACARFGFQCVVYMGAQDMERQALNVFRMRLLGAEVNCLVL